MYLLQEEGDLLCLAGGSDTQGEHCDEGRGQWTERDNHRKVCTSVYECVMFIFSVTHSYDEMQG